MLVCSQIGSQNNSGYIKIWIKIWRKWYIYIYIYTHTHTSGDIYIYIYIHIHTHLVILCSFIHSYAQTFTKRTPAVTLKSSSYFKLFPSSPTVCFIIQFCYYPQVETYVMVPSERATCSHQALLSVQLTKICLQDQVLSVERNQE